MADRLKVCTRSGCPNLTRFGRCSSPDCDPDRARGTAAERGYMGRGHQRFRRMVLVREPLCVCARPDCHGHSGSCLRPSTVADHHPRSRRRLVELGLNPDDPKHGRGVCTGCHNRSTAQEQPGGWHGQWHGR